MAVSRNFNTWMGKLFLDMFQLSLLTNLRKEVELEDVEKIGRQKINVLAVLYGS